MDDIFKILRSDQEKVEQGVALRIGLDIRIGGREVPWPLTEICRSREDLVREIEAATKALERIAEQAESLFDGAGGGGRPDMSSDLSPEEIWQVLSGIDEEAEFIASFNALDTERRREVAEYVLTQCNVFSGRPAVFSARFDSESGLIL